MLILDVGCGSGQGMVYNWFGIQGDVIGIDIRPGGGLTVRCDAQHLPFISGVFDKESASEIVEHLRDPILGLNELYRVLKKGGMLYMTTPNGMWFPIFVQTLLNKNYSTHPEHFSCFIPNELRKLVTMVGFQVIELSYFTRYISEGRLLPKISWGLSKLFPSVMHMNIMIIAKKI